MDISTAAPLNRLDGQRQTAESIPVVYALTAGNVSDNILAA